MVTVNEKKRRYLEATVKTPLSGELVYRWTCAVHMSLSYDYTFSFRWQKLLADSEERKQTLLKLQEQYRNIEDLYLAFAKKASAFNSWFENAEEDLTDPVRCNSVEEIKVSYGL